MDSCESLSISIGDDIHMCIEITDDEYVDVVIDELERTMSFLLTDLSEMHNYLSDLDGRYHAYDNFLNENSYELSKNGFNMIRYDDNLNTFIKFDNKVVCIRPDFNHNILDEAALYVINNTGIPYKMNTNSTTSYFIEVLEFFLK